MSKYRVVEFVDDETFNSLPGHNMEEKVGVAYPEQGIAYARRTGVSVLDAFTALHELEHLEGKDHDEHYDAENQCYYKGFGDVVRTVAPIALSFIPGVGTALGGALSTIGRGVQGIAGNFGLGNVFGQIGNAVGGALGVGGGSPAIGATTERTANLGVEAGFGNFGRANQIANSISGAGAASGVGSAIGGAAKQAGGTLATNAASSLFSPRSPLSDFRPSSLGSDNPSISAPPSPNIIPGSSGEGSQGGPGGAPGSIGGGQVSKIKQYLAQRDQDQSQIGGFGGGNY